MTAQSPKSVAQQVEMIRKENQVVELRIAGLTWRKIAEQVGYADHSSARDAWIRACKRVVAQPLEEHRTLALDRNEALFRVAYLKAIKGDMQAMGRCIQLIDQAARLRDMFAPIKVKHTMEITDSTTREIEELAAALGLNDPTAQLPAAPSQP